MLLGLVVLDAVARVKRLRASEPKPEGVQVITPLPPNKPTPWALPPKPKR